MLVRNDIESLAARVRSNESGQSRIGSKGVGISATPGQQTILAGKVISVEEDGSCTIRVTSGPARTETRWEVPGVISVSPDATISVDEYVSFVLNPGGQNLILAGGGAVVAGAVIGWVAPGG